MYIIAIGWAYVVLMLVLTASSLPRALAALVFLGILPLLLFAYLAGKLMPRRRSIALLDQPGDQRDTTDAKTD